MGGIIVVGVDGSETAKRAAESAKNLAAGLDASLHVVSAFDSDRTEVFGSGSDRWIVSDADAAEQVARTVAESLGRDVAVTYSAARGRPADALIKEAVRMDARIIVVGNRRMHGIGRVLGSVANSVAHNAPCDVYIANTYDAD
ncbi:MULTISPECIES: universal stress protein [Pseudarthrobacter]|jgi:nucleotide-binding universal stress UspA family protein|uniref:Nucleotide-binding universal stress UspA family protein n=1 Tax=Pseudarthrobacter niigatensis TaxID=369935 RepID=A0AAJ1SZF5_9MICC|nr:MULTISPECIES: universal stress protein [Pseudarthrobacter]MDQ0147108.1 nucleotide-binding universal stress UspA family protein [Pseudarthrobacter niigatensis]MDQ0267264.1 nucleotide-binding universal stress UspA family protein [Pseudarthrobacter niigatensis]QDG61913.1 universal stress protein [Pseudarthrobacter sp. NIBRBAC000502771]QDG90042.1 universal stress protein [Pseudarthrobacter sp. NIBRBAC000502770]